MPPMSDQPLTAGVLAGALAEFHHTVLLPDVQGLVGESERRLTNQIERLWDALLDTRERLETDYQSIKAGLARVEHGLDGLEPEVRDLAAAARRLDERLSRVEKRLDSMDGSLIELRARVDVLGERIRAVE